MSNELILSLLQTIALMCSGRANSTTCQIETMNCIQKNHHTEAWPTRSWACFKDSNYPDDSGDKK